MKSHFLSDRKPERLGSHLHARCHALVLQQHFRREAHKATTLCEFLSRCVYRIWHAIRFLHGSAAVCMLLSCSRSWCAELVHSKLNLWTAVLFHLSPPPPVSPSIAGSSHTLSLTLETLHTFGSGFFCHVCEQRDISACVCEWVCSFRFTVWLCWRMYHRCSLGEELCCCVLAVLCCRVG